MDTHDRRETASRIERRGRVLAGLLATALFCAVPSFSQTSAPLPAGSTPPAKAPASAPASQPARGAHDSTKVHGYWIIEVRNPDGKVAKHMEFENQLCTTFSDGYGSNPVGGDTILSSLLGGTASAGAWSIVVGAAGPISNPPNCDIQPYVYLSQTGVVANVQAYDGPPAQGGRLVSVGGIPASISCSLQSGDYLNPYEAGQCNPFLVEAPAPAGQIGINLSGQFNVPAAGLTISAVGTQLFTCSGTPGPPRPADCKNIGVYASNLYQAGTPCIVENSIPLGQYRPTSTTTWIGCIPGDPSTNTVNITSYAVDFDMGQNPFSGVVLTGTNGVPAPFAVTQGQTVAINWTLTFQ